MRPPSATVTARMGFLRTGLGVPIQANRPWAIAYAAALVVCYLLTNGVQCIPVLQFWALDHGVTKNTPFRVPRATW